jgi:hypothetical protein
MLLGYSDGLAKILCHTISKHYASQVDNIIFIIIIIIIIIINLVIAVILTCFVLVLVQFLNLYIFKVLIYHRILAVGKGLKRITYWWCYFCTSSNC